MNDQYFRNLILVFLLLAPMACTKFGKGNMELRINMPEVTINYDPQKMEDMFSMMIALQLYRGLMRYDAAGGVQLDIAAHWEKSKDNLKYKFKLKDAKFSDGKAITSRHVQMTFARMFFLGSSIAADIDYIAGAKEFKATQDLSKLGVRPITDKEIEFTLSHPSALFLKHVAVADCSILPLNDFKENLDLTEAGAYSGPYKIKSLEVKNEYRLEKWRPDALDSANPPREVVFFRSSIAGTELAKSKLTDSLDAQPVSAADSEALGKLGWISSPTELTGETFVILNPKYIPLEVRRNLYLKTNPKELVEILNEPRFKVAFGLIPVGLSGDLQESDVMDLYKDKTEYKGKKISFKLDYDPESEVNVKIAEWLKKIWSSDKVEVNLNGLSKGEKLDRMFSKKAEATIGRKGVDYPDGFSVLTYFKGQYASNYFHVEDKEIDKAIGESLQMIDPIKQAQSYKSIQKLILKHYTNIPLFFGSQASGLWSPKVSRVPSHPMGVHTMPLEVIEMRGK